MKTNLFPALRLTLFCALFFSGIYTVSLLGIAKFAPNGGKGEIISQNGKTYYSNIGQSFSDDKYFNSRPSAVGYNAAGSAGSNKGPSNPAYLAEVQARIDTFMVHNPTVKKSDISADLVTASGSGLDPNISVQGALVQVPRVAKLRKISPIVIEKLVEQQTEKPLFGLLGTSKINVLKLNLALDELLSK